MTYEIYFLPTLLLKLLDKHFSKQKAEVRGLEDSLAVVTLSVPKAQRTASQTCWDFLQEVANTGPTK